MMSVGKLGEWIWHNEREQESGDHFLANAIGTSHWSESSFVERREPRFKQSAETFVRHNSG